MTIARCQSCDLVTTDFPPFRDSSGSEGHYSSVLFLTDGRIDDGLKSARQVRLLATDCLELGTRGFVE